MARTLALVAALLATACQGDDSAPSSEENRQLDTAENLLEDAPNQLQSVGETLPEE